MVSGSEYSRFNPVDLGLFKPIWDVLGPGSEVNLDLTTLSDDTHQLLGFEQQN
jgi:hypothetical protein